ncbi:MAG: hypothetical protein ACRD4F_10205 [Candidatus Angelobacter sp.]
MNSFTALTTYFLQEGRDNLDECLRVSFQAAKTQNIRTIVIFTAQGDGIKRAMDQFLTQPEYEHVRLVGVSFPAGKIFKGRDEQPVTIQISQENKQLFAERKIPIVSAHFPFDGLRPAGHDAAPLARDLRLISDALNIFSGSMSLCVQAITLACDAGHIEIGEHVIAMTADTSILATATVTHHMLSDLVVREVLCKPAIMNIARGEQIPGAKPRQKIIEPQKKPAAKKRLKSSSERPHAAEK